MGWTELVDDLMQDEDVLEQFFEHEKTRDWFTQWVTNEYPEMFGND